MQPYQKVILGLGIIAVIFIGVHRYLKDNSVPGISCTMEVKLCPDGSYVGRQGPSCEFASCPGTTDISTWKTFSDTARGITFQYPEKLMTTYIYTNDWPPKILLEAGPFTCTEAGLETNRAGQTKKETVNGRTYCVTTESEGAAGSIYSQYAYAFPHNDQVAILTFTLQLVQCLNYEDPQKTACLAERNSFSITPTVDRVAQSLQINY